MKTTLLRACVLFALAASASAEIIGVDTFDYPNAAIAGQSGGTFWDFKNVTPAGHTGTASNWDTVFGTAPATASGRLVTNNSGAKREYDGASETQGAVNDANVNKVVYYRVTLTTGATLPEFFGLSSFEFGTERIFIGRRFGQANLGVEISGGGASQNSTIPVTLAARIDCNNTASGNTIRLYVNPDLNASEPTTAAASIPFTNTESSTAVRLASGFNGDAVTWDHLVVATTWDELGAVVTTAADGDDGSLNPALGGGVSLREAVNYAPAGSLVTFDPVLSGQTIALGGTQLFVNKSLTIDASGLPLSPTIDAQRLSRVLKINPGGLRVALDSLTLTGGRVLGSGPVDAESGGGISSDGATLRVRGCTLFDNAASVRGGAIFSLSGTLSVESSTFPGNASGNLGGAIMLSQAAATVTAATFFSGNTAAGDGGGIHQFLGTLALNRSIVAGNTAATNANVGGSPVGAGNLTSGDPRLTPTVGANLVGDLAGAGTFTGPALLTGDAKLAPLAPRGGPTETRPPLLTVTNITDASAGSLRAALAAATAPDAHIVFAPALGGQTITRTSAVLFIPTTQHVEIDASSLAAGITISGAGAGRVLNSEGLLALHRLTIRDGFVTDGGAGIFSNGTLLAVDCTIAGNTTASLGGGLSLSSGVADFLRCTISGNTAANSGGISQQGSPVRTTLRNSTIAGNQTTGSFGGGMTVTVGSLDLRHCTISQNVANGLGGGFYMGASGSVRLERSIVAGNTDLGGNPTDIFRASGTLTPVGPNLIGSNASVTGIFLPGPLVGTNAAPRAPLLAPLGDYGGPADTMPPIPGSPAIDAAPGSAFLRDQRGFARISTADLGAAEFRGGSDVRLYWLTDWDDDGNAFGLEHALGTDPLRSDRTNARNLTAPSFNPMGQPSVTFGVNPAATPGTIWRLTRSTDLLSFSEIYRFDGTSDFFAPALFTVTVGANSITVLDKFPPSPKAFYRFEAISP